MKPIVAGGYSIYFNESGYYSLNQFIADFKPSKIAVITDNNTSQFCKNLFLSKIQNHKVLELCIQSGEINKNLDTCLFLWQELSKNNFDRKSLIINLGGGVVTDLGGFVASTFLRGIAFINIPTSLLAMVDASVGGKTGIDLGVLKNQIGVMANPKMVVIDQVYLKTLPVNHFNSGIAEVLKHGLIHSEEHWTKLTQQKLVVSSKNLLEVIFDSVSIKDSIVKQDYFESGLRKSLNFGHTLGHAIESYSLSGKEIRPLLHGEAIGIGMILEAFLSAVYLNFPMATVDKIKSVFKIYFDSISFENQAINEIISYLMFDKKNNNKQINFVLLEEIGKPVLDVQVSNAHIIDSFQFYLE